MLVSSGPAMLSGPHTSENRGQPLLSYCQLRLNPGFAIRRVAGVGACTLDVLPDIVRFFDRLGMGVNPAKCVSLRTLPVPPGSHRITLDHRPHLLWKDQPLPVLTNAAVRYLGVHFDGRGQVNEDLEGELKVLLGRLESSALRPLERFDALVKAAIPRLLYRAKLTKASTCSMRSLTREVRIAARRFLGLPSDTPSSFMHCPNGLGLIDFEVSASCSLSKCLANMAASDQPALRAVAASRAPAVKVRLRRCGFPNGCSRAIKQSKYTADSLKLERGKSLAARISSSCKWLLRPGTPGWLYKRGLRIVSGVERTAARVSQIHGGPALPCRRCGTEIETQAHVLAICPFSNARRIARHDWCVRFLSRALVKMGFSVHPERLWATRQTLLRPDISAVRGDLLVFVEVTIPYETDTGTLLARERDKSEKYSELRDPESWGAFGETHGIRQAIVPPVAIGATGTLRDSTITRLRGLGFRLRSLHFLRKRVMRRTVAMSIGHLSGRDRTPPT